MPFTLVSRIDFASLKGQYLDDDVAVAGNILAPPLTAVLLHLLAAPVLAAVHTLDTSQICTHTFKLYNFSNVQKYSNFFI